MSETSFAQDCPSVEYSEVLIPDSIFGPTADDDLAERRVSIHVTNGPFATIVYRLAYDYGVKFGFEASPLDRDHEGYVFEPYLYVTRGRLNRCHPAEQLDVVDFRVTLNADNQKLRVVLDDLVRQMTNYKWTIRDGMVNVSPKYDREPVIEALLDLRIAQFRFKAGRKIIHVFEDLRKTTELRGFRKTNNIEITMNSGGIDGDGLNFVLQEDIEFNDLTVRELLNKLGKLNKVGWIIRSGPVKAGRHILLGV